MRYTINQVAENKWLVAVDFSDEGVDRTTSNEIIGTEDQAIAYAPVLARDFRENNAELFPLPQDDEGDHEEDLA